MSLRTITSGFLNRCLLSVLAVCAITSGSAHAETSANAEYRVKSAFLINFSRFVSWPELPDDEFNVCVHGKNPFGKTLDSLQGRPIKDRTLTVTKTDSLAALNSCQVVFLGKMSSEQQQQALEHLKFRPTLTVGESTRFIQHGGMIRFLIKNGRVGFEINQDPAIRVNLKISSKLLRLSTANSESENR